jgi:uncharacterized membrane protein
MPGLTPFGVFHTLISLVAVIAGVVSFVRSGRIGPGDLPGKVYVAFTVASCVTALGIFHHGGFGPPHAVAILTLGVLGVAALARATSLFGRASRYVETIGYSATFLFHMIPAVTETSTRLPPGHPLVADADAPALKATYLVLLALFALGAAVQWKALRGAAGR